MCNVDVLDIVPKRVVGIGVKGVISDANTLYRVSGGRLIGVGELDADIVDVVFVGDHVVVNANETEFDVYSADALEYLGVLDVTPQNHTRLQSVLARPPLGPLSDDNPLLVEATRLRMSNASRRCTRVLCRYYGKDSMAVVVTDEKCLYIGMEEPFTSDGVALCGDGTSVLWQQISTGVVMLWRPCVGSMPIDILSSLTRPSTLPSCIIPRVCGFIVDGAGYYVVAKGFSGIATVNTLTGHVSAYNDRVGCPDGIFPWVHGRLLYVYNSPSFRVIDSETGEDILEKYGAWLWGRSPATPERAKHLVFIDSPGLFIVGGKIVRVYE